MAAACASVRRGIHSIEVTLRMPAALDAIRAIAAESPRAAESRIGFAPFESRR